MRVATVRHIPQTGVEIHSPYDADFVTELKVTVPHFARKWIPLRKVWIVSDEYRTAALQLLRTYFTVIDVEAEAQQRQQRERTRQWQREWEQQQRQQYRESAAGDHAVMHLLPSAPPELIKVAFHCLAKLYHPDHGGDLSTMQRINLAYEELKK